MMSLDKVQLSLVVSQFNNSITDSLKREAINSFIERGGKEKHIKIFSVPGAFEIPGVISQLIKKKKADIIVALGCIIKGETPHFDYISTETSRAIMKMIVQHNIPIGFGVLTTNNMKEAINRSKSDGSNKGREAMEAALDMYKIYTEI